MSKLIYLILLIPSLAFGAADNLRILRYTKSGSFNILSGVALNASAGTRTITLSTEGYSKLLVQVNFTYAAATTLTSQFTCSLNGVTYGRRTSKSTTAGAVTVSASTETYTTGGASVVLNYEYDVRGCSDISVVYGGASGGASDLITVQATAVVGG